MSLDFVFDQPPADGESTTITDGIEWLRMPLPFSLNHINLWLLRDGEGWAIVDTGFGDDTTRRLWHRVFETAMRGDAASHIIATHMHPDHIGCAGFLTDYFDTDLWMTRDEYTMCRILVADTGRPAPDEGVRFYRAAGFTTDQLALYQKSFGFFGRNVTPLPEAYKRISEEDELRIGETRWSVMTGGGHSPEHASLYNRDRNLLIAGDQLLPSISSNVSVWPTEPLANPLRHWFESLRRLRAFVPEDVLVLPAHGKPFRGAHERIDALIRDHEDRLDQLREFCRAPRRAVDVFPALYRVTINDSNRIMATGEALAHLHYLVAGGEMTVENSANSNWFRCL